MTELIRAGYALIRLATGTKLVSLPVCAGCKKPAPECRCGNPTRNGVRD